MADRVPRIGIGGPVGSGKTALIEALVPKLIDLGHQPLVITNDIFAREDAEHARRTLEGVLSPGRQRIRGVETGAWKPGPGAWKPGRGNRGVDTAVREDPSLRGVDLETWKPGRGLKN